jgi:hypothetical protein
MSHEYFSYRTWQKFGFVLALNFFGKLLRLRQDGGLDPMLYNFLKPQVTIEPNKLESDSGRPLQPILMFASKAGAFPSEVPFRHFNRKH